MLLGICALVFIYCAVRLAFYSVQSAQNKRLNEQIDLLYETPEVLDQPSALYEVPVQPSASPVPIESVFSGITIPAYQHIGNEVSRYASKLYSENSDLIGWLNIPDVLALPVVYRDNEFYLTHDFYGRENTAGTIFLDEMHPLSEDTQLLFIHGHAMYDGSMFGMITHYRNPDFIKEHPYLTFNTLYSSDSYEIIGSLFIDEEEICSVAGLGRPTFRNPETFNEYIETLRAHALHFTNDEIPPDTALLALSTCYKNGRIVVLFKRTASVPI